MKQALLLFGLFLFCRSLQAQPPAYVWANGITGNIGDDCPAVCQDASGRTGAACNTVSTSLLIGPFSYTQAVAAKATVVSCLDNNGGVQWATFVAKAQSNCMVSDGTNFYVAGTFWDSAAFGVTHLYALQQNDAFLAKFDAAGNCLWAKSLGGYFEEEVKAICLDANGAIVLAGYFSSDTLYAGNMTLLNNSGNGTDCVFLARYDAQGNPLWLNAPVGSGQAYSLVAGTGGAFYVSGDCNSDSMTFGAHTYISHGWIDCFIAKYDGAGNAVWATGGGGSGIDQGGVLATDPAGNVYMAGNYRDSAWFDNDTLPEPAGNLPDVYLVKYTPNGNVIWINVAGGPNTDYPMVCGVDPFYNVYVGGSFFNTINFGQATLNGQYTSGFLAQYDAYGNLNWAMPAGSGYAYPEDLYISGSGDLVLSGSFTSAAEGFGNDTLYNWNQNADGFVTRLNTFANVSESAADATVSAFPNPFADQFTISLPGSNAAKLVVADSRGRTVINRELQPGSSLIDMSEFAEGIYTVRIFTGSDCRTLKMVHAR